LKRDHIAGTDTAVAQIRGQATGLQFDVGEGA
jgi:hypothetical protein